MITQSAEIVGRNDPSGSIFLPENQSMTSVSNLPEAFPASKGPDGSLFLSNDDLVKKYLSFRDAPENVLGMLFLQASAQELPALLEELDRKLLLTRGGYELIDSDIDPFEDGIMFDAEIKKRARYHEVLAEVRERHAAAQKSMARTAIAA